MSDDLKDILSNSNKDIDNQKLMDYLSKQLSTQESHELEKMMADDEFINDAVEGLEQIKNIKSVPSAVDQLNRDLKKQIDKKKLRKEKHKIKDQPWVYFTIIFLLLVTIICYVLVKKFMDNKKANAKPVTSLVVVKKIQ